MKILIIDDEYRARYTKLFLELSGYEVDWIDKTNTDIAPLLSKYQVLIMDLMMVLPENSKYLCKHFDNIQWLNSGLHIMVYIREQLKISSEHLKIVLYSARNETVVKDILQSRKNLYDRYIRKQLSDEPLLDYLTELQLT